MPNSVVPGTGGNLNESLLKKSFSGSSTKKAVKGMAAEEPQRLVPSPPAQILHGLAVSSRMPNSVQCLCPADAGIKRV